MATDDAYLRAVRALNWRNAQLRAYGIEPMKLTEEHGHEPPIGYDFSAEAQSIPVDVLCAFLRNLPVRAYHHGHRCLAAELAKAFETGEWRNQHGR